MRIIRSLLFRGVLAAIPLAMAATPAPAANWSNYQQYPGEYPLAGYVPYSPYRPYSYESPNALHGQQAPEAPPANTLNGIYVPLGGALQTRQSQSYYQPHGFIYQLPDRNIYNNGLNLGNARTGSR